jgi:hypothetical protein
VFAIAVFANIAAAAPGVPTPVSPLGEVSSESPEFVWRDQDDATHFRLWLYDRELRQRIHVKNYRRTDICSAGVCSVSPAVIFTRGTGHRWNVRARNSDGYGDWSKNKFNIPVTVPNLVELLSPTGSVESRTPEFRWSYESGVEKYRLYIRDLDNKQTLYLETHESPEICTALDCGIVLPDLSLPESTRLQVRIRAWNSAGWNLWSENKRFEIDPVPSRLEIVDDNATI